MPKRRIRGIINNELIWQRNLWSNYHDQAQILVNLEVQRAITRQNLRSSNKRGVASPHPAYLLKTPNKLKYFSGVTAPQDLG